MQLVKLQDGPSQWRDIEDAADTLWRASQGSDINDLSNSFRNHHQNPDLNIRELSTNLSRSRRLVVTTNGEAITIAFLGSDPEELIRNLWTDGVCWWVISYPVHENGHRIHSFFHDMWHDMRESTWEALNCAVESIIARGSVPRKIIIAGYSMGGGISILAFKDILHHIRGTWGSPANSPQKWARDENIGSVVQHITFAAVSSGDIGYYTDLNNLYDEYHIPAWDFFHHADWTVHFHHFAFRSWRGYRYTLPEEIVGQFYKDFEIPLCHGILGYLKTAEWMSEHGKDQVKSHYTY